MKKGLIILICLLTMTGFVFAEGQAEDGKLLKGNLRIVIGSSSTGGDTYANSAIVAEYLAEELDLNVKVDATGVNAAYDALNRDSSGHTIMIFHDQAYLGYLYGKEGYSNPFENYIVGPSVAINPGNAYLAPANSPYNTLQDAIDAAGTGTKVRVAIQPGGVSEIGYTAMKNAVALEYPGMEENMAAVNTGSQSDKNQLLFDGQADIINGSIQANEQYTQLPSDDIKAMKFLWMTARNVTIKQANPEGYGDTSRDDLLKFVEPSVKLANSFTFDKEFFIIYNKDMDSSLVEYFDAALTKIFEAGAIQETQKKAFFIPNYKTSSDSRAYFNAKMMNYEGIISSLK
jgi:putative tricarboxylic transport membrane protein